nr:MAG TPA: replisome organizer [Caudoviricetes sp.]
MCNGWIKLHRKIVDWEWFTSPSTLQLFIYLLLRANKEDKKWRGILIKRGQLVTSVATISEETKLSTQQVRSSLNRLKSTNEITSKTTNRFTLVTVCKYESYQLYEEVEQQTKQQALQQTNNKQITNKQQQLKNNKNIRNNKKESILTNVRIDEKATDAPVVASTTTDDMELRKEKFYQSLVPYVAKYGKDMVRAFYDYWTEKTYGGRKMRFEKQQAFEISKRLATWQKHDLSYANRDNTRIGQSGSTRAERDAEFLAHVREKMSRTDEEASDIPFALRDC